MSTNQTTQKPEVYSSAKLKKSKILSQTSLAKSISLQLLQGHQDSSTNTLMRTCSQYQHKKAQTFTFTS